MGIEPSRIMGSDDTAKVADALKQKEEEAEADKAKSLILGMEDLKQLVVLIQESIRTKESRVMYRALRSLVRMRPRLTESFVGLAVGKVFDSDTAKRDSLLGLFPEAKSKATSTMDVDEDGTESKAEAGVGVQVIVELMAVIFLIDNSRVAEALALSSGLIDTLDGLAATQRSLDPIAAQAYFYWARCHELSGSYTSIRKRLFAAHRTATLKTNEIGQATLHNLIMRNYMEANLLDQADNFNSKTTFPEVKPAETARHMYYVGRLRTVQLEYSEAYACLMQAARKAPQERARGFRSTVQKLLCVVQLLMGEVPERKFFNQEGLIDDLAPYCAIAGCVRNGDLVGFAKASEEHAAAFRKDKNHNLIVRLRHNVIKAGLRKLNVSYSRISLADICSKLGFDSVEATESIVAKAIRDGVVDGLIDHDAGYLQSNETTDIYTSNEPQEAFKRRIRFCLDIHNEAVMAMQYPEDAHKDSFETAEERLAREKEENEFANTLQDEDDGDEM